MKLDFIFLLMFCYNVFQNDEFDVFSRDLVDLSWVYKGKSVRKEENMWSLLNDKCVVVVQWQCYEQYSVVVEEVLLQLGESLFYYSVYYEDEYDDIYDGNQVGVNDVDLDDEFISCRLFIIFQVLRIKVFREGQEEDDDEEEEVDEEVFKFDYFVQDFVVLREKVEVRCMVFFVKKGYWYDSLIVVVGSFWGYGQSCEIIQECRKKEVNKVIRVNYNWRMMVDCKRSKGMILF